MINMYSEGNTVRFTASGDVASGELVMVGDIACIAVNDVADGAEGVGATRGVYTLPKDAAKIDQGVYVYLDATGKITETDTGSLPLVGKCWVAALAGDSTVAVGIG